MMVGAQVVDGGTWFRVWAPRPRALELEVAGRRLPASRDDLGHAALFVPGVGDGARYSWLLDGDRRRPDPASRSQPEGVHGPSQVVDPRRHRWGDGAFRAPPLDAIYELHVGTFSPAGTFDGVAEGLDRVLAAGFRTVELMPVNTFAGARGWGYDGVGWLAPQACYGGPERLRALVDHCHRRGVAVLLDVVLNHLGPEGNYLAELGPYFKVGGESTPWGPALDLDGPAAGPVRAFLVAVVTALADEFHLDGVRLDAVHAFVDSSPQHVVAELAAALHAEGTRRGRPLAVVAESDLAQARVVEPATVGGWGCDAMWADDFHHALHAALTGERGGWYADFHAPSAPALLARALERGLVQTGRRVGFRQRRHGEPAAHLHGGHIVAAAQNHDQIGNRALGERLVTLVPGAAHAIATALFTSPFLPLVFQGDEYGETRPFFWFSDLGDRDIAAAAAAGRAASHGHGPDPRAATTFAASTLAPLLDQRGAGLVGYHQALLQLRRLHPTLGAGPLDHTEATATGHTVAVRRLGAAEEFLAAYQLAPGSSTVELPAPRRGRWHVVLDPADHAGPRGARIDAEQLTLPGYGALVLRAP